MLQYAIIVFSIIYFCDSAPKSGSYAELVLTQRYPISSIFYDNEVDTKSNAFLQYLGEHQMIFAESRWVIESLLPYNASDGLITRCVNASNQELTLDHNLLNSTFQEELKEKWPVLWPILTPEKDEASKWAKEYREAGSCVTENAKFYFEEGVRLLDAYNVGEILNDNEIAPGSEFTTLDIYIVLMSALRTFFNIKCITPEGSDKQYLYEVQICFTNNNQLRECKHGVDELHRCSVLKPIEYPA